MIYRTTHQANFSVRSNALLQDNTLSDPAYRLLNHLLSLPPDWTIYPKQLMKYFKWSKDRTYKALKELRERGYAVLIRCRRSSIWKIYESPLMGQSDAEPCIEIVDEPSNIEASKIPSSKNSCFPDALQNNKISLTKKKNTTTASSAPLNPIEPITPIVVVPFENEKHDNEIQQTEMASLTVQMPEPAPTILPERNSDIPDNRVNPEIIEAVEKLPVTQTIKPTLIKTLATLTLVEAKAVLAIFSRAIVLNKVQNPVGYAVQLVKASQNGTLTPVATNYQPTLAERLAKQEADRKKEAERHKITNEQWVAMMAARGIKVQI